jgi:general transcription factor 3C polypeptide 3 (transcription factor C subunit 4)
VIAPSHILARSTYEACLACAVAAKKFPIVVEQSRKLIGIYQFNNEPLRILLASLASGMQSTDSFITSTLQKHIFRELRLADTAVKHPDGLKWNQLNRRWVIATGSKPVEDNEIGEDDATMDIPLAPQKEKGKTSESRPRLPTTNSPIPFATYGQICIAAKSYQSAICTSFWYYIGVFNRALSSLFTSCL